MVDILDVSPSTIKGYLVYCKEIRKNKPVSLNHKLHDLKIFFNFLEENDLLDNRKSPTKKINYLKEDIKIEVFKDAQIRQMLSYYQRIKSREKCFYAYRDYSIILTLFGTGMRLGELVNLRWSDIDFVNSSLVLFGKKRQQSSIPMTDKLKKELSEYKIFCEKNFNELSEFVFVSNNNTTLTANAVKCVFKRLKGVMNFKGVRLSAHTFRHTFAHRCIMAGMDVFSLQKMLRHSKLAMTEKYLALWGSALKEQNDKFNPLNNFEV